MKTLLALLVLALAASLTASCDILRSSPFEVAGWNPGEGCHDDPAAISVSLVFSHNPDHDSVERHFQLSQDGEKTLGVFRWEGKTLHFLPLAPLEINRDYTLSLSAEAHDTDGLSMDSAFEQRFTTRPEGNRPVLHAVFPEKNAVVRDLRASVRLVFSRPMSINSVCDNISFSPSISGSWRLADKGVTAIFTPAELWTYGRHYEMRISASLAESTGLSIGKDIVSVFDIGDDAEKPVLSGAYRITESGIEEELAVEHIGVFTENPGWEKGDKLKLVFSKAVDALSVKNSLTAEGVSALVMETPPGIVEALVFRFETFPVYAGRFVFRLKTGILDRFGNESAEEYVFRIFANGANSKPPQLYGIRIPMAPGNAKDQELVCYRMGCLFETFSIDDEKERYPSTIEVKTWIECYFETAPNVSVDPLSLMELFRIETSNSALTFSPRQVKTSGFSAEFAHSGWEEYQRIEIEGILVNSTNSGVVHIQIADGLADNAGNRSEKAFRISLLK